MLEVLSGIEIGHDFVEEHARDFHTQSADGIMNRRDEDGYEYVWLLAMIDYDLSQYYLLDVRTSHSSYRDNAEETRDFLFVATGSSSFAVEWFNNPINFGASAEAHQERLSKGLGWFVDSVTETESTID